MDIAGTKIKKVAQDPALALGLRPETFPVMDARTEFPPCAVAVDYL
jgi:hypothetical protein